MNSWHNIRGEPCIEIERLYMVLRSLELYDGPESLNEMLEKIMREMHRIRGQKTEDGSTSHWYTPVIKWDSKP